MSTPGSDAATKRVHERFSDEFRDAIAPRTLLLGIGTGLLCLAFMLSYVGAFHAPKPHRLPVAVVAPAQVGPKLVAELNGIANSPLNAHVVATATEGRRQLTSDHVSGVFIPNLTGTSDTLLVASGGGATVSNTLTLIFTTVDATQHRSVTVTDAVPHQVGDTSGGAVFYLVIGCILAGYLLASSISSTRGARPATVRRTAWRLGMTIPYALFIGLGAAVIGDPVLGALTGHFAALWGIGTLLVLAAATTTIAFQILFGFLGIALTILVFVVLGSPSAGGAYPYRMLPTFWRSIGPWLPNGAGVDALRRDIYFNSAGIASPMAVLIVWVVGGAALAGVASFRRLRRDERLGAASAEPPIQATDPARTPTA
jgi:hypothetical protein